MSIQSLISANSLVAAGIDIGDVVTIYTLGRRIGNRTSGDSGDRDLRQIRMGYVGKRIVLPNSLFKDCLSIEDIAGFTLLDTDAGAIPHNPSGLIEPGIASNWRTYDYGGPPIIEHVQLHEPPNSKGFTRHIQPDWDNTPERLLLCIRY
jgi:hypothetical protein